MGFPENGLYHQSIRRELPMRHPHDTRLDDLRQPAWEQPIADALGLSDYTDTLPATAVARCLLLAATLGLAVSAVARRVTRRGRETLRLAVAASLPPETHALESRLAAGLRRHLPRALSRRAIPIAIDIHRRPYYGDHRRTAGLTGGRAERGTKWFWSYATAVSLKRGQRHTLAVGAVDRHDTPAAVVERLLAQVAWAGVRVSYVLLDRAFYAVGVINALRRRKLRFILPVVRRGKAVEKFFRRGCRGWFEHTLRSRRRSEGTAGVRVAVVAGPDGRRPLVFACSEGFHALPRVVLRYRRRFGIESSYRQLGECLAKTTSRDRVYRLLLVGVGLLIRAWWVGSSRGSLAGLRWVLILTLSAAPTADPPQPQHPPRHPTT
jgi:hypothetical protein